MLNEQNSINKLAEEPPKIFNIIKKIKKGETLTGKEENFLWMAIPYLLIGVMAAGIIVMLLIQKIYK